MDYVFVLRVLFIHNIEITGVLVETIGAESFDSDILNLEELNKDHCGKR